MELEVKNAKTCLCGCGEIPQAGREYCWGHKGKARVSSASVAKFAVPDKPNGKLFIAAAIKELEKKKTDIDIALDILREL